MPVERIVVAAVAEVEKTARGGQKVEGRLGVAAGALEDAAAVAGPLFGLLQVEEQGEPDGEAVVAQAAGTVLEVGLQVEDGVAELGVAGAGDLAELLGDGIPLAQHQTGQNRLMKLLVERKVAGQKAAVQRGQRKFQVIGVEAASLFEGARTGAGAQADVPHALDNGADRSLGVGQGLVVGKGEQHVNVRVGEKILAPVAAHRHQRDVRRRLPGEGAAPHFDQKAVHHRRAAANGRRAVTGAFAGLAHQRHLLRILLPKIINRKGDWIHKRLCVACRSK